MANSDGSGYLDLSASYEVAPKLTLVGHVGQQKVKNASALDYVDYKLGVAYDLNGWVLGAAYVDTDVNSSLYTLANAQGKTKDIGGSTVVLSVLKTF